MDVIAYAVVAIIVVVGGYLIWTRNKDNPEFSGKDRVEDAAEWAENTYQDAKDKLKK